MEQAYRSSVAEPSPSHLAFSQAVDRKDLLAVQAQMKKFTPANRGSALYSMLGHSSETFILQVIDTPQLFIAITYDHDLYHSKIMASTIVSFWAQYPHDLVPIQRILFRLYRRLLEDIADATTVLTTDHVRKDFRNFILHGHNGNYAMILLLSILEYDPMFMTWMELWPLFDDRTVGTDDWRERDLDTFWPYRRLAPTIREYMPHKIEVRHRLQYTVVEQSLHDAMGKNLAAYMMAFL